jgi:hypothetical protein
MSVARAALIETKKKENALILNNELPNQTHAEHVELSSLLLQNGISQRRAEARLSVYGSLVSFEDLEFIEKSTPALLSVILDSDKRH